MTQLRPWNRKLQAHKTCASFCVSCTKSTESRGNICCTLSVVPVFTTHESKQLTAAYYIKSTATASAAFDHTKIYNADCTHIRNVCSKIHGQDSSYNRYCFRIHSLPQQARCITDNTLGEQPQGKQQICCKATEKTVIVVRQGTKGLISHAHRQCSSQSNMVSSSRKKTSTCCTAIFVVHTSASQLSLPACHLQP